jgi:DNA-binding beta-propeller fold protein YncE
MKGLLLAVCLLPLLACQAGSRVRSLGPLESEGELYLYLQPFPPGSDRLAFALESVSAVGADGAVAPLDLVRAELSGAKVQSQRLFAWGRLSPGSYGGLLVKVRRATLEADGAVSDLLVEAKAARIDASFAVGKRRATVLWLTFRPAESVGSGFAFTPAFSVGVPEPPFADLVGYCSSTAWHNLAVFDKRARQVVGVLPTGRAPMGIAIDPLNRRAYVALSGEDQVATLDVQSSEEIGRVQLRAGDRPRELGLTPDGRLLVVVNSGSDTASFVDPFAAVETARVQVGIEPTALLVDRSGLRAYVFNRRSASMTILDLANRAVVGTIATDPEPVRGKLNRAGTRLYVVGAGSAYMTVYSVPDLAVVRRVFVGLGGSGIEVDSRTDFVYVADRIADELRLFDPASLMPVSRLEVPGPVTLTDIDDVDNVLLSVVPISRLVGANDLVSGASLSTMEVGDDPYQVVVSGERR